jgi:hypothetical protein
MMKGSSSVGSDPLGYDTMLLAVCCSRLDGVWTQKAIVCCPFLTGYWLSKISVSKLEVLSPGYRNPPLLCVRLKIYFRIAKSEKVAPMLN